MAFRILDVNGAPPPAYQKGPHDYIAMCREHHEWVGIGADCVNSLFR